MLRGGGECVGRREMEGDLMFSPGECGGGVGESSAGGGPCGRWPSGSLDTLPRHS